MQVLCGSEEQLREAEQEVAVMRRLRHPCLLPLLDAATQLQRTPDGGSRHVVLMLFPGGRSRLMGGLFGARLLHICGGICWRSCCSLVKC